MLRFSFADLRRLQWTIRRLSFAFTADGKRETEICVLPKIKETDLILAPFLLVMYKCSANFLKEAVNEKLSETSEAKIVRAKTLFLFTKVLFCRFLSRSCPSRPLRKLPSIVLNR